MRSRPWLFAAAATGATFAALAALVARGRVQSLDQYAVDHWMRKVEPRTEPAPMLTWHQLYPRLGDPVDSFFDIWSFPASPHISGLLVAGGALVLARRGRPAAGVAWIAAWVCANAVEVVLKQTLERPLLRTMVGGREVSFRSFESSFPSGHALRAVLVAGLLAALWRRASIPALLWAAVAAAGLVVTAAHTPSDVAGGILLAVATVCGLHAALAATRPHRMRLGRPVAEEP